jgi:opacity protein-like surface antigen
VKKWILTVVFLFMFSSLGFASPLMDYSRGECTFDLDLKPNQDISVDQDSFTQGFDGKSGNLGVGITYGLGNDWAIQYRFNNANTKAQVDPQRIDSIDFSAHEFNVLHKISNKVSAFAGAIWTKPTHHNSNWGDTVGSVKTGYQVGLIGVANLGAKTNAFGIVSTGNVSTHYEAGLSYAVARNVEVNVAYEYSKYRENDLHFYGPFNDDYTVKGIKYGLTYKFN